MVRQSYFLAKITVSMGDYIGKRARYIYLEVNSQIRFNKIIHDVHVWRFDLVCQKKLRKLLQRNLLGPVLSVQNVDRPVLRVGKKGAK
jgi:hypothetical protein